MIVLDTHVLVWWVDGGTELSRTARNAIRRESARADGLIVVSSITAWEITLLVQKGRLLLRVDVQDWLGQASRVETLQFVPVDNEVAVQSTRLPGAFHPDPADRMFVALARHLAAPLVTADDKIRSYQHVNTIW